ncbi:unnamed protein product [Phytomonas sp. Hart1]|nr:unnamed protein product [Phytomonas sp. Hart1]|eukprot:CCW67234.1 unnamed protein product [Phytomonas sp. isolate Hart1]
MWIFQHSAAQRMVALHKFYLPIIVCCRIEKIKLINIILIVVFIIIIVYGNDIIHHPLGSFS